MWFNCIVLRSAETLKIIVETREYKFFFLNSFLNPISLQKKSTIQSYYNAFVNYSIIYLIFELIATNDDAILKCWEKSERDQKFFWCAEIQCSLCSVLLKTYNKHGYWIHKGYLYSYYFLEIVHFKIMTKL